MKLSKLIAHLKDLEETHGDIKIRMIVKPEEKKDQYIIKEIRSTSYSQDDKGAEEILLQSFYYR